MRNYEFAFIISPNVDDDGVTSVVEKTSDFIKSIDGQVASVNVWGRRKLAYPIEDFREGTYVVIEATVNPPEIPEFERNFRLVEEVIRYLVVKAE